MIDKIYNYMVKNHNDLIRKPKTRRGLPKQLRVFINEFLDTREEVENLRDIWYKIKHKIEHLNTTRSDDDWDTYVNEIIGEHLYRDKFLCGDIAIYEKLNVITKALEDPEKQNKTPIVLFSEKTTRAIDNAATSLLCAKYNSTGQIPSFEAVKVAEYLIETAIDNKAYIVGLTDYDPAGESIFKSLVTKVKESIAILYPLIELHQISIKYGSDYKEIIDTYDSFTLSTNPKNKVNQVWIKDGRTKGVELNVLPDKQKMFEDAILKQIDPSVVEQLSKARAINRYYHELLSKDEEYLKLMKLVKDKEVELSKVANDAEYEFKAEWNGIDFINVRDMTQRVS